MEQASDGGHILLGYSDSSASGDVTGMNHGATDYWVVKLDGAGAVQWQALMGGGGDDDASSVCETGDGGYILLGYSVSSASGDVTGTNHGATDYWAVILDASGAVEWQALVGGTDEDTGISVDQTADGGYVLLGGSMSSESEDVTGINRGIFDYWVVKLEGGPPSVVAVPPGTESPTDIGADGTYDDVNGNGR